MAGEGQNRMLSVAKIVAKRFKQSNKVKNKGPEALIYKPLGLLKFSQMMLLGLRIREAGLSISFPSLSPIA